MQKKSLLFRWLDVAGLEFTCDDYTLLIDPYLSRISLMRALFSKVRPDEKKIFSRINAANSILVTHSHFDHLMDVPAIAKRFGCPVYGSPNTCALLKRCDVPLSQIREVVPGNDFSAGPFHIKVLKSSHSKFPFIKPVTLPKTQDPPQYALDFGMDTQFSYRISIGPIICLTDPGMEVNKDSVDILFVNTMQGARTVGTILKTLTPGLVIPIHWENYFKPVSGSHGSPGWGLLPVKHVSLKALQSMVHTLTPRGRFFLPGPFNYYRLEDIL